MYSDYISCVYPCSSQPYSIYLMYTAIFCLQQQTNANPCIKTLVFSNKTDSLNSFDGAPLFILPPVQINSLTCTWILLCPLAPNTQPPSVPILISNGKTPPISLPLQRWLYHWGKPGGCSTQYLWSKNALLIYVFFLENSLLAYGHLRGQAQRTHSCLDVDIPQRFAGDGAISPPSSQAIFNERYAVQSGSYFMMSRYRKQYDFPMRKWWAQALWDGNENKEHSCVCNLEQHPSV